MSSGSNIRVVGPDSAPQVQESHSDSTAEDPLTLEEEWTEYPADTIPTGRNLGWLTPALAILAIAAWTGFYAWANKIEMLAGGTPQQWSGWIVAWSIPVLLVISLWLLAMRNSRREASRFGDAARLLSDESSLLESRLASVNRELSLAREFLGSQSRELDSLGRIAAERISQHAESLQSLIQSNGAQVDAIASVSGNALENMVRLRDDLPVIANSARDVSNQIGSAGRTAHAQIEELISGFQRLNEFGQASERQVSSLKSKIDTALAELDAQVARLDDVSGARFEALRNKSEDFRADLDGREVEALAALRRRADQLAAELAENRSQLEEQEEQALVSLRARIGSLRDEGRQVASSVREGEQRALEAWSGQVENMQSQLTAAIEKMSAIDEAALASSQAKLQELAAEAERVDAVMTERSNALRAQIKVLSEDMARNEQEAIETLSARLAEMDEAISARRAQNIEQTAVLANHGEGIAARFANLQVELEAIAAQGSATETMLGNSAEGLAAKLEQSRMSVDSTSGAIRQLTEDTIRLLELIQASSQHSQEALPAALDQAGQKLSATENRVRDIHLLLTEAGNRGETLSNYVISAKDSGREAIAQVEEFHTRLSSANAEHHTELENLRASLAELSASSDALSANAHSELRAAIALLERAAKDAVGAIGNGTAINISNLAERIGTESAEAIDRALRERTQEAIKQLEVATAHASSTSREAAVHLRDQLVKVDELAGNLETRVARARERAEEQVDNDFSRRVALITDSLNSNAIDISKALSSEVTDTAWASYLRGDRGIFTRRAVRLLDNAEARNVADLYAGDSDFAENVSRYIHDFEAMLRAMLSTRDGNTLGVTLISSDMGKLYVALAQAIERLRN